MAAMEQHTQYKRELHAGDAVSIHSTLLEVQDKSIHMRHKMLHDVSGEVAATSKVVGVHIYTKVRKAIRLPEDVRRRPMEMNQREVTTVLLRPCA